MPVAVFCSYAHEDEVLRDELHKRLKILERGQLIRVWHDRRILPGGDWGREIDEQLRSADLILLLISPDFLASEYANDIEVTLAMQRHKKGQAVVVPVILRPSPWESTEFAQLQALPKDGLPVTKWPDRDDAYLDIARGIRRFVEESIEGKRDGFAPVLPEQLKPRVPDAELTALERNYLAQVKADLDDRQLSPLGHTDEEEIALEAQILVEPEYKVFQADVDPSVQPDRGKRTSNLVKTLLHSTEPVVVLGQPGAGKSVALRRVGLSLVDLGKDEREPRIPVYLPLGEFTTRLDTSEPALAFATRTLLKRGGHAAEIAARLRDYLHQGRMVFLLDAMDEMPRDDYKYRFEALRELTSFRGSRFLFACRSLDYRESFKVTRAIIQPLSRKAARELLLRAMPETGREAASRILSPDNPRRNLAGNPFFLRLFCLYYKRYKDLPPSRAALVEVFEQAVYLKASKYDTEGLAFDQRTMHLTLARLGYLIEVSHRGVTLPLRVLRAEFGDGSAELARCYPHLDEVIRAAAAERLLVRDDHIDPGGDTILSFYHHRLQEYYAAVYLDEFDTPLDWTSKYDDIWWQEILIMLFGITESPERYMRDLLATVPEPVTMGKLAPVMASAVKNGASAAADLTKLDGSGFYGLRIDGPAEEAIANLVVRVFGKQRSAIEYGDTPEARSAKASGKPDEECVRRYLESRNAVLLDRVELAAECLQNVAAKLPGEAQRVQAVLSAFIKDGNTWEIVRAIGIGAKLQGIDLYELIEPALIGGNTWCRQEALEAVANAPVESSPVRQVGIVLFLQFLKGDLWFSVAGFTRQVWERRVLFWLLPGFLALLALSAAAALSPFAFYLPLLNRLARSPHPPAALGAGWPAVTVAILIAGAGVVYYLKYRYKLAVLTAPAWAAVVLAFPILVDKKHEDSPLAVALIAITIFAPQIAQTLLSAAGCAVAGVSFRSIRVLRGWRASLKDIWSRKNPLFGWQIFGACIVGFFVLLAVSIQVVDWIRQRTGFDLGDLLSRLISTVAVAAAAACALAFLVWPIAKVVSVAGYKAVRAIATRPRESIALGLAGCKAAAKAALGMGPRKAWEMLVFIAKLIGVMAVAMAPFVALAVLVAFASQNPTASMRVAIPLAAFLFVVLIVFLCVAVVLPYAAVTYYEEFGQPLPISFRTFRGFGFLQTEAQRVMNLLAQYDGTSARERFEAFRAALPKFKEDRWQSVLYRQMEKAYKEIRQDAGRKEQ